MKLTDEEVAILLHHPYFEKMWTEFELHIKKLEERIIALEVGVRNLTTYEGFRKHDQMAGEEYWEHG